MSLSHNKTHTHECDCKGQTAAQSLDELEFEKGIWSAAQYGELDKVNRLIGTGKYGVDQLDSAGYTALHYASRNGHLDVCTYLLDRGANVDMATKAGRATALHRASLAGKTEIVKLLLLRGANPEMQDGDGKTALHRAAENGHIEICNVLTSRFPHLKDISDKKGKTPIL